MRKLIEDMERRYLNEPYQPFCSFGESGGCSRCPLAWWEDKYCDRGLLYRWLELAGRYERVCSYCKNKTPLGCEACAIGEELCSQVDDDFAYLHQLEPSDILYKIRLIMEADAERLLKRIDYKKE